MEQLATMDGEQVNLDDTEAAFAAAMAAPAADRPGMAAPARKPAEPAADPVRAPHGWTWDGAEWRPKKAHGRPRSAGDKDRPRVAATSPPAATPPVDKAKAGDWRRPLREALEGAWLALAIAPVPERAFGFELGGLRTRLRVQASLIQSNVEQLATGINQIGQHNRFVAAGLARLQSGEAGLWVLPTMLLLAPFAAQTGQLWSGRVDDTTLDAVAGRTETAAAEYLQAMVEEGTRAAASMVSETA